MIDQTIAHYKITAKIGEGGMGEVYRATDTKLEREVAIKILPSTFAADVGRMSRFEREAKVLASLNHPNIAAIYGVEERALVMELVDGETLKGPLALDVALRYAKQITEALEYAHERGVIHRDLKPANIKVRTDGTVKLLDFGLAKAIEDPAARDDDATNSPTLTLGATRVGVILGTAAYMSPEQASGKAADRRADIWSFGAVLFEMLSGKRAFEGESVSDTLASVLKIDPDWNAMPATIPPSIRTLVQRCLKRDRKQHLQAIGDARIVIEEQLANPESGIEVTPRAEVRHSWLPWGFAFVSLAATLVVSWFHFREVSPPRQVLRYTIAAPENGEANQYAVSPDGYYIAMSVTTNGKQQIWLRPLDAFQWQPMPFTEGGADPFWSPDSRFIAFFAEGKLKRITVSGGPAQTLCNVVDPRGGSWNRDDVIIFAALGVGLQRVSASGGVPTGLTKAEGGVTLFPVFLPNGREFFVFKGGTNERQGVYLRSLDGTKNQLLLAGRSGAVFLPSSVGNRSGHLLFVRENTVMAQSFDPEMEKLSGDEFPVAESVDPTFGSRVSVSENGVILYRLSKPDAADQIVWFDRSGKLLGPLGVTGEYRGARAISR